MMAGDVVVADLGRGGARRCAIIRLEARDRAPAPRPGRAQIVERGVVALGDIAAVAGIDRWRGDERPRVEIDQRAVAAEPGGKEIGRASCRERVCQYV